MKASDKDIRVNIYYRCKRNKFLNVFIELMVDCNGRVNLNLKTSKFKQYNNINNKW